MGYTTDFEGAFRLNKPLDPDTLLFLQRFNETRRMGRNVDPKYGIEGEFYVESTDDFGQQERTEDIINYKSPPSTQPSLWCQWRPSDDGLQIEWDGGEKFYKYVEWIKYLIEKVLAPKGYSLTGEVKWVGEIPSDWGIIDIKDNVVRVGRGKVTHTFPEV